MENFRTFHVICGAVKKFLPACQIKPHSVRLQPRLKQTKLRFFPIRLDTRIAHSNSSRRRRLGTDSCRFSTKCLKSLSCQGPGAAAGRIRFHWSPAADVSDTVLGKPLRRVGKRRELSWIQRIDVSQHTAVKLHRGIREGKVRWTLV